MTKRQTKEAKKALRSHVALAALRHPGGGAHGDKRLKRSTRRSWRAEASE
jgi:hypothetical protein